MDNARRKIRICLVCVVTAAVIVGLIYYINEVKNSGGINEGTLVKQETASDHWHSRRYISVPESRG